MNPIYPELHLALTEWVTSLLPGLREYQNDHSSGKIKPAELQKKWGYEMTTAAFEGPKWARVVLSTRSHEPIERQINQGITTDLSNDRVDPRNIGSTFTEAASQLINAGRPIPSTLDEEWFDSIYAPIEAYFHGDTLPFEAVIPLVGLVCESYPLRLDNDSVLDRLSDDETRQERQFGLFIIDENRPVPDDLRFVLRRRFRKPKTGAPNPNGQASAIEEIEKWRIAVTRAIAAAIPSRILSIGRWMVRTGWVPSQGRTSMVTPIAFRELDRPRTVLREVDGAMVALAWSKFALVPDRNLGIAAERLSVLADTTKSEENLVDILIAIEAMLGKDLNEELPYRISLRAARFISEDLELSQRVVFDHVRQAFRLRNKVLRSLRIDHDDYLGLQAQEFVHQTEAIARKTLQKLLAARPGDVLNWDDLQLRAPIAE